MWDARFMRAQRLAPVLAALLLSACALPGAPDAKLQAQAAPGARSVPADLAAYYPAPEGAVWHYAQWSAQDGGPETPREGGMTIRVTGAELRSDGTRVAYTRRESPSGQLAPTRILTTASAVSLSRASDPEDGPSLTILRFPFVQQVAWKGRSWPAQGAVESVEPQGFEAVTVPAGTYDAWRVDHVLTYANGAQDRLNYWYAPGVGAVKLVERLTLFLADGGERHLLTRAELTRAEGL